MSTAAEPTGEPLLRVCDLCVDLPLSDDMGRVLHHISFDIGAGEALGLVGETGSGKSMTARSIAQLLPVGAEVSGTVRFAGADVLAFKPRELQQYRMGGVAVIFQDPWAHINPVHSIGDFLTEALRLERGVPSSEATRRAVQTLESVGIDRASQRMRQYPHELSGGMLQRMMIASVLLAEPKLILADEPTTALDVTTQSEVMAILDEERRDRGMALLFISHDLDLAASICDRTAVMYAGQIVEIAASSDLEDAPRHPYTAALHAARPHIDDEREFLDAIPGRPISGFEAPRGCAFAERCPYVEDACREHAQELRAIGGRLVRCRRAEELEEQLRPAEFGKPESPSV